MNITQLDDDGRRKVLQIEVPWSEIADDYHAVMARYAKVRIPGFRPSKAPISTIAQRFKREIAADLKELISQRLGREALRDLGAEALGSLEAFEMECDVGKPFSAKLRFFPMPEFRLPDLADFIIDDDDSPPRDQISRRLLELVQFEVPDEMARKELELDGLGATPPGSDSWTAAAERIRLMIILKRIAGQEGIEVDETDVSERITEKAGEFGTTKEALDKELKEGGGMARLRDLLVAERTLEYIEQQVSRGE